MTREQRLESALRHARAIIASELADLRCTPNRDAQVKERELWIAAWDDALNSKDEKCSN